MGNIDVTTAGIISLLHNLDVTMLLKETAEVTAPLLKLIFEKSLDAGNVSYDFEGG